jgi:chitinase
MTYGMAGAWGGWQSWHSSAILGESATHPSSVDSTVAAYVAAGVPIGKLGVGVGFYGMCWAGGVTGPGADLGGSWLVGDDNTFSYTNIMTGYYDADAYYYDLGGCAPYLGAAAGLGAAGCTFLSYEDEISVAGKADYVLTWGLGGVIIWTINQGYLASAPPGERDPLLTALGTLLAE